MVCLPGGNMTWLQQLNSLNLDKLLDIFIVSANIYLTVKLKAINTNREILNDLRDQNSAKDELIKTYKQQIKTISEKYHKLKERYDTTTQK